MNDVKEARTIGPELILGSMWRELHLEAQAEYFELLSTVRGSADEGVVADSADEDRIAGLRDLVRAGCRPDRSHVVMGARLETLELRSWGRRQRAASVRVARLHTRAGPAGSLVLPADHARLAVKAWLSVAVPRSFVAETTS